MEEGGNSIKDTKRDRGGGRGKGEEDRQRLPEFTAELSLFSTTSDQRYYLTRTYGLTHGPNIRSAQSFLNHLCYYKCMIGCSIICSPPTMCLISCPQQCRTQCGPYGI